MSEDPLRIRRARRTDFTAVMRLLASTGMPVPPPERAVLHRFRNIVNDLGGDFYLAFDGDELVGLIYALYARRLALPPIARIEHLVASPQLAATVAPALVGFICQRAVKRGCTDLQTQETNLIGLVDLMNDAGLSAAADRVLVRSLGSVGKDS